MAEAVSDDSASHPSSILGADGKFRIVHNAMGVPGLHVAVNVFDDDTHQRLFFDQCFTSNPQPFVVDQEHPLQQCIFHPTLDVQHGMSGPWPNDWHRLINAVRDSGLFPTATIPDNAYALTYPCDKNGVNSKFDSHWDSRYKWGEYVISVSLGAPCTLTFEHAAPKSKKPFDASKPWTYEPPPPPSGSYYTRSQTAKPDRTMRRKLWQVSMTLPPNSMYVMSGPSRYDWKHGINVVSVESAGARRTTAERNKKNMLIPTWNSLQCRRAVIFRSTKVFSDYSLQVEYQRAVEEQEEVYDESNVNALHERVAASKRFQPQDSFMRPYSNDEIRALQGQARGILVTLERSGVHRLRFEPHQVQFDAKTQVRAVADKNDGLSTARSSASKSGASFTSESGGHRFGGGQKGQKRQEPEIVVIDSSSDESEGVTQHYGKERTSLSPSRNDRKRSASSIDANSTTSAKGIITSAAAAVSEADEMGRLRAARLQRFG